MKPGANFGEKESRLFSGEYRLPVSRGQQPGESGDGTPMESGAGLMSLCLPCLPLVTAAASQFWDSGDSFLALLLWLWLPHPVAVLPPPPRPRLQMAAALRDESASRSSYVSSAGQPGSRTPKTQPLLCDAGQVGDCPVPMSLQTVCLPPPGTFTALQRVGRRPALLRCWELLWAS